MPSKRCRYRHAMFMCVHLVESGKFLSNKGSLKWDWMRDKILTRGEWRENLLYVKMIDAMGGHRKD
jgi:hypothetical protein